MTTQQAETLRAKAREVITAARCALGPNPGSLTDLLLDNLPELQGVAEARALLAEIGERA
jgi:hypothetical protein